MADQTPMLVFASRPNGEVYYWNRYWLEYSGLTLDQALERGWSEIVHPDDLQKFITEYFDAVKARQSHSAELRMKKSDGKYCYFLLTSGPRLFPDGDFTGYVTTGIDVDENKQTQLALQESRDQLAFAIEAARLATWDYNPLTDKFSSNDRLKNWFGLPDDERIELHHAIDAIAEKDRQRVTEAIQKSLDFASGGDFDIGYTIVHPVTKKETNVRAKGRAWFNEAKMAYRFNGTLVDVTVQVIAARKITESEQRFQAAVQAVKGIL